MTIRPIAVVGDSTTGGGHIVEGRPWFLIDGQPAAFVGAKVLCGTCGATVIVEGSARAFVGGMPFARHGDLLACGHRILTPPNRFMREISDDEDHARHSAGNEDVATASRGGTDSPVDDRTDGSDAAAPASVPAYRLTVRWKSDSDASHAGLAFAACADRSPPQHACADDAATSVLTSDVPLSLTVAHWPPPVEIS